MVLEPGVFRGDAGPSGSALQVLQVEAVGDGRLIIIARCLATTRLGACFRRATPNGDIVELTLAEIHRYPNVAVSELDPAHGTRAITAAAADCRP